MASSLSNLVDIAAGIHKIKCKDFDFFLEYESINDNLIKYEGLSCNEDYSNKLDEKFKKQFKNIFKLSDNSINKFVLLLRKVVYSYEYMDDWKKFNETTLSEKEEFYVNLNMKNITEEDYIHIKSVSKDFEIKKLVEYHDLYLKSNNYVFENFRKVYLQNYGKAALKKTGKI